MGRRALLNLGLLLLALGLAALVWLTPGEPTEDELSPITSLRADEVTSIFLRLPHGEEVVLEKEGASWMMAAPVSVAANDFLVETLLDVVGAKSHASFAAEGRDLGEYRLALPLAVLRANGEEIAFGGTEALNQRRYVRVGDRIHLIDDVHYYRLQSDHTAFVSSRLLPAASSLQAMDLPGLSLVRDGEGRWHSEPPGALTQDAANELADAWLHAQALDIEPHAATESAGGSAADTVRLRAADGAVFEFVRVERDGVADLARNDLGLAYRFADEQMARLLPAAASAPE
jgi:hypothetical protein